MPAYAIVDVNVTDPKAYDDYRKLVPASLEKYGGRFLVRGGVTEVKEGDWKPTRMVLLEFPSMARAKEWYHSPEYSAALAIRLKAANAKFVLAEGL